MSMKKPIEEMGTEELRYILHKQTCELTPRNAYELAKENFKSGSKYTTFYDIIVFTVIDIWNYGYICGQRAERARIKNRKKPNFQNKQNP